MEGYDRKRIKGGIINIKDVSKDYVEAYCLIDYHFINIFIKIFKI